MYIRSSKLAKMATKFFLLVIGAVIFTQLIMITVVESTNCCWPYKVVMENDTLTGFCDDGSIANPCCSVGSCSLGCCFCDPCRNKTSSYFSYEVDNVP